MDGWIHRWMDGLMDAGAESDLCMKGLCINLTPLTHNARMARKKYDQTSLKSNHLKCFET